MNKKKALRIPDQGETIKYKDSMNIYSKSDIIYEDRVEEYRRKYTGVLAIMVLDMAEENNLSVVVRYYSERKNGGLSKNSLWGFQDKDTKDLYMNIDINNSPKNYPDLNYIYDKVTNFNYLNAAKIVYKLKGKDIKLFYPKKAKNTDKVFINNIYIDTKEVNGTSKPYLTYMARKKGFANVTHQKNMGTYLEKKYYNPRCINSDGKLGFKCYCKDELYEDAQRLLDWLDGINHNYMTIEDYNYEKLKVYKEGIHALNVMHVDHINGNPGINKSYNLQVICPPCHVEKSKINGDHLSEGRKSKGIKSPGKIKYIEIKGSEDILRNRANS